MAYKPHRDKRHEDGRTRPMKAVLVLFTIHRYDAPWFAPNGLRRIKRPENLPIQVDLRLPRWMKNMTVSDIKVFDLHEARTEESVYCTKRGWLVADHKVKECTSCHKKT